MSYIKDADDLSGAVFHQHQGLLLQSNSLPALTAGFFVLLFLDFGIQGIWHLHSHLE